MWQFTHCPRERSPAISNARMSRLRVRKVYSVRHPLNQRTLHVPVNGLTLRVQTLVESLQLTLIMERCRCENCSTGRASLVTQFPQHLVHLVCIDGRVVPCYPIASRAEVATDLPVHHAALELLPGGLKTRAIDHTRLSGVVEEFIVLNPERRIPGLVVCPTVVRGVGSGAGHVVCVVDSSMGQMGGNCNPPCATRSSEHQISDSLYGVAILHNGVTQPVLTPGIGTRLTVHGVEHVSGIVHAHDIFPLIQGGAADEVLTSDHVLCVECPHIIGTGWGGLGVLVCHLANWLPRPTSLYHLVGKFLQTASHKRLTSSLLKLSLIIPSSSPSMIQSMSSMSCSR